MDTIEFDGKKYPALQSKGFAAKFAFPFADEVLSGNRGVDIGYSKQDWIYPKAYFGIDNGKGIIQGQEYYDHKINALNIPDDVDYCFGSHMLEHTQDWVEVLDHWKNQLKTNGKILLYLPHKSQRYWRVYRNRKHIHSFDAGILRDYFNSRGFRDVFVTKGYDLNHSFYALATK